MRSGADERFWTTTRGRIVQRLRAGEATVNELADELKITDNGVRSHLASLEGEGLVRQSGLRPGVRKPNFVYSLTERAERLFPKAYGRICGQLLAVLGENLPPGERDGMLRTVGQRLAKPHRAAMEGQVLAERLRRAVELLNQMGGAAELEQRDGRWMIRGRSCPLGEIVSVEPEACALAEAMLSELLGVTVHERCEKGQSPHCCFEVEG